jgi:hypothetical protein
MNGIRALLRDIHFLLSIMGKSKITICEQEVGPHKTPELLAA